MTKSTNPLTDQPAPGAFAAPEIIPTASRRVKCDGGGGALGHPVVWYDMGEASFVECGYCDRRFVIAGDGDAH